ncbi:hypothetical protein GCM10023149_37990 [Mucilaginibacter gynuensis]|uniref:UDP:flavonoid glycosyltransferase YjiC (YdhE family) n=1 Tax=Mucilaginibacter gynuensis TaxID=1302236 RepID=A0ABP8GZP1_9SPHI
MSTPITPTVTNHAFENKQQSINPVKVLFIPNPMPSHIIPLIALAKKLNKDNFDTAFLLPKAFHAYVRAFKFNVLDIDKKAEDRTTPEMIAFSKFKPNVVVDDLSYTTAFSTRFGQIPRISVVRRGVIPHEINTPGYKHSSKAIQFLESIEKLNLPSLGMWTPKSIADLFIGDVNIIPSSASIEELPEQLKQDTSYVYSGALTLADDALMGNLTLLGAQYEDNRAKVEAFVNTHADRPIVYFTHGLTEPTEITNKAQFIIKSLLNKGVAVITNFEDNSGISEEQRKLIFAAPVLPMQFICSHVNLMIHHCGSGTYNYQVLHEVPAIILGSRCYDRDDVAKQLNKKNAAVFISADLSDDLWYAKFEKAAESLLNPGSEEYQAQKSALALLNSEMRQSSTDFDFGDVIVKLLSKPKSKASAI